MVMGCLRGVKRAGRWPMLLVVMALGVSMMACLLGDGDSGSEEEGESHACFVHCNTGFGISSACFSSLSDYRTQRSCEEKAVEYCGEGKRGQNEMVELCECSASCEPEWYPQP